MAMEHIAVGKVVLYIVINRNTILLLHMFIETFHSPSGCQAEKLSQSISEVISEVISEEDGKSVVQSV